MSGLGRSSFDLKEKAALAYLRKSKEFKGDFMTDHEKRLLGAAECMEGMYRTLNI